MDSKIFLRFIFSAVLFSCGNQNTVIEKWENGNIKIEHINFDKDSFVENRYHENGRLWAKTPYKNGKRNGKEIAYYKNGQSMGEATYINDTVNGKCIEYYPNGKLMFEGQQIMGKLNGQIKRYYANGGIKREELYNNGIITSYQEWDIMGNKIK